ncbi:MAG TPA: DUF4266 domain-containing protein [Puia sp.]|nr:DUF4266 domain-containing protein [Puia sp.]
MLQPKKQPVVYILCIAAIILHASCKTVKPYQRAYLNDDAMQAGKRPADKLSSAVHTYREGASGGGSGKTSGGCGCN